MLAISLTGCGGTEAPTPAAPVTALPTDVAMGEAPVTALPTDVVTGEAPVTPPPTDVATGKAPVTALPTDMATGGAPVLTLRKSGGFAGVSQEWMVYADGRVVINDGSASTNGMEVPAQAVQELLTWLEGSGFFSADYPTPGPDEICCDRFLYELSATVNDQTHTVVVLDTPENLPGDLAEAFRRTAALLKIQL